MSGTIKVLHIIKTLGLGGAETNLLNLVRAFDRDRIETHVAYSYGGEIEPRFVDAGVRLFKYAHEQHKVGSVHSIGIVLRLARYIRRHRIDIVQTHNFNGHIWGLLAAKLAGAKVVEHVHDFRYTPTAELARRHGLVDQYRHIRWFRRLPDRVVVLTRAHARYVVERGIALAQRVIEIQNGIPIEAARPSRDAQAFRRNLSIPDHARVILTAARMDPSKNIDLVLDCAAAVVAQEPDTVFVIAGAGPSLDTYRTRCTALGLDRCVRFAGFVGDIESALGASDVFVLPSFLELHSIAILEATKMGVPVVVSRGVGCNDEFIVDGTDGFLCDPFDIREWIDAVLALVRDADLRRRVGERGRDVCRRRFDIRGTAQRFESLYGELADSRSALLHSSSIS